MFYFKDVLHEVLNATSKGTLGHHVSKSNLINSTPENYIKTINIKQLGCISISEHQSNIINNVQEGKNCKILFK